jgi:hypothetical protein
MNEVFLRDTARDTARGLMESYGHDREALERAIAKLVYDWLSSAVDTYAKSQPCANTSR